MSDSDDTDILLLIPPDFFNIERDYANSVDLISFNSSLNQGSSFTAPSCCENIMSRQYYNSSRANDFRSYGNSESNQPSEQHLYFSTPRKDMQSQISSVNQTPIVKENFLNEIDTFLHTGNEKSVDNSIIDVNSVSMHEFQSLQPNDFKFTFPNSPQKIRRPIPNLNSRSTMMSLNEIWGNTNGNSESISLQEERLRRQHCEKNIQNLQIKILEYEQKIAVAINVDKEKNEAINKLEDNNLRLSQHNEEIERRNSNDHEKLLAENAELKNTNLFLEKELSETITVMKKLQEKNDVLENKVDGLTSAKNDVSEIHKSQKKDLEIRLANSKDNEKILKDQLSSLRNSHAALKESYENEKTASGEVCKLKSEMSSLRQQNDGMKRKLNEASSQNEDLNNQIKDLKQQINTHNDEKKNLLKELDVQRMSLKKYYQSQVEDVVSDKLKEFQNQLNSVEDQMKSEAKRRERLIAERGIKQIELISQKNDQEINLLCEKYDEEIALYRLQLANASKTIQELEEKLSNFQSRRADIAEQLHTIMETQWKKALEVLTSPSPTNNLEEEANIRFNRININHLDKDKVDGIRKLEDVNTIRNIAENENGFQTPKNKSIPIDILHNYIELLLTKSPKDLEQLDEILMSCKKNKANSNQNSSTTTSSCTKTTVKATRPWK